MKNKHLAIIYICLLAVFSASLSAARQTENFIKISDTAQLSKLFAEQDYTDYLLPPENLFPRIFINNLPPQFAAQTSERERNRLFLMSLAPLALKINEELADEKQIITYLRHKFSQNDLDNEDEAILEDFAKKYDIATPMRGYRRYAIILKQLELRVDVIPPSLYLAIAAIDTNWGQASFLPQTNNLYRELNWYTDEGLKPAEETEDDTYRIRIYPSLYAAMKEYALKLNSSVDYMEFRQMRKRLQTKKQPLSGKFLAPYLIFASDLPNFAGLLDYTITFYNLDQLDQKSGLLPENPQK